MTAWKPHPLRFEPIFKPKVWGGRALKNLGKSLPGGQLIGESWELADLPTSIAAGGQSRIADGPFNGMTLHDLMQRHEQAIMGDAPSHRGRFPLLIKLLDARENLSVQVHPSPAYAAMHPEAHLKSEAWVILEARPGAVIYRGVKPGITPYDLAAHVRDGSIIEDLIALEAVPGECHYLPSGTCHALGAGIVVAEVQTPSDTTFRVYDWGRSHRALHIEQAMQCIDFEGDLQGRPEHRTVELDDFSTTMLTDNDIFRIERINARRGTSLDVVTSNQPVVWMMLKGGGALSGPGQAVEVSQGDTILMPAGMDTGVEDQPRWHADLHSGASFLRISLTHPSRGTIA